jgi:hypothetical protein
MLKYLDPDDLPVGWKDLCVSLDSDIQQLVNDGVVKNFHVEQLKEKFGALRLYFSADSGYSETERLIDDYTHVSAWTCAKCGAFPADKETAGWIYPLCCRCAPENAKDLPPFEPQRQVEIWLPDGSTRVETYDTSSVVARIAQRKT